MVEPLHRKAHRAKGDWRQGLRIISTGASWPGELDTIVIFNTGPHYSVLQDLLDRRVASLYGKWICQNSGLILGKEMFLASIYCISDSSLSSKILRQFPTSTSRFW